MLKQNEVNQNTIKLKLQFWTRWCKIFFYLSLFIGVHCFAVSEGPFKYSQARDVNGDVSFIPTNLLSKLFAITIEPYLFMFCMSGFFVCLLACIIDCYSRK